MNEHINLRFLYTDGNNSDFIELCHRLDDFLNKLVGGEENRASYIPYNKLDDIHDVILVYDNDIPIGCASFKKYDPVNSYLAYHSREPKILHPHRMTQAYR